MTQQAKDNSRNSKPSPVPVDYYARDREVNDINIPPFKEGESVKLKGNLYVDSDGQLAIDPVYEGSFRPSVRTQFKLGKPSEHPELNGLIGKPAEITLQLNEYRGAGHLHSYSSTIVGSPAPITVSDFSKETLKANEHRYIGIEGTVVRVRDAQSSEVGELILRLKDGQELSIEHLRGKLTYESGVHENVSDHSPEPGDRVQLTAFVHSDGRLEMNREPYMSQAHAARERDYIELRREMQTRISGIEKAIASQNYSVAREQVGQFALNQPTTAERENVYQLIKGMPAEDQPIYSQAIVKTRVVEQLALAYGENAYSKTQKELLDYASRLAQFTGRHVNAIDPAYVYRLLKPAGVSLQDQTDICERAIKTLAPQVVGVDQGRVSFESKYMLERAINYLGDVKTQSAADLLVDLLDKQIRAGQYRPAGWKAGDPRRENIVQEVASAIDNIGSDAQGLSLLGRHLKTLRNAETVLSARSGEDAAARQLGQVVADLFKRASAPMSFDGLRLPPYRLV